MPSTAQTLLTQAVSLGYDAPSWRDLKEALLAVAAAGSGSSTPDAQTLIDLATSLKYGALSERDILVCLCGFYAGATTAQQAVTAAASNKYAGLSDAQLDEALLAVIS